MNPKFLKLIKEVQFYSPLRRYFFPRYVYNFSPPQLCFLCQCIEDTKNIEGAISEIGCAAGSTTIFLNKYMDAQNIEKPYYAIDTFSGFASDDIAYEITNRGKAREFLMAFRLIRRNGSTEQCSKMGLPEFVRSRRM